MPTAKHVLTLCFTGLLCLTLLSHDARAQATATQTLVADSDIATSSSLHEELPDAPQDQKQTPEQAATTPPHQDGQTKRILGIIPNFRAVSADVKLPPQSFKEEK